jgi:hypothetical protein
VWERGTPARPRKLATLTDSETEGFLEGVEQELRLGGWSPATG